MKFILVWFVLLSAALSSPCLAQGATNASVVGNYIVTGTETDGKSYDGSGPLEITFDKNGALELKWDNGKYVGIGQVVGDKLFVASAAEGKVIIGIMDIKPDGSMEGKYWRRTDSGTKGTEVWKKK
jgi:hypothetical protein